MKWSRSGGKRCAELEEWISAYADGQTTRADAEVVEAHLSGCAHCAALLRRHRRTRGLIRLTSGDSWTPPDLRLRIVHAITSEPRPKRRVAWPFGLAACLTLALLVGAFSIVGNPVWHAASNAPTSQPSPAAAAPTHSPTLVRAACSNASGRALARCLGVPFHWLPSILGDERYERANVLDAGKSAIRPPLPLERHSPTQAVSHVAAKGGATAAPKNQGQHGLIPT